MNLISTFLEMARSAGQRVAIVSGAGEAIGFSELALRSGRLAATWRAKGVRQGDRVLVAMPVGIDLYTAIAALWRLGAVVVFPEPAMGAGGVRRAVEIAQPRALLTTGLYRLLPLLVPGLFNVALRLGMDLDATGDPLEDVSAEHPALISFTSGSTGRPKGIVRSHGFLAAQNAALHDLIAPRRDDETDLVAFPVFVIANLALGITSVLPNWRLSRHDQAGAVEIARHAAAHRVTRALLPPSICEVVAAGDGPLALDTLFTGGGPVFPDLLERLASRLPATRIVSVYGSTEAEPIAHQVMQDISAAQWAAMKRGSGLLAGRPIAGLGLKLLDGEIVVTGAHVNKSYLGGVGDTDNKLVIDGEVWHRTGDAGHRDAEGFLWLRGRLSGRAGNFYPFELETAARFWPGVRHAALVPSEIPPLLALEGNEPHRGAWRKAADALGTVNIVAVKIPLDRRHRSKVDYVKLRKRVGTKRASTALSPPA